MQMDRKAVLIREKKGFCAAMSSVSEGGEKKKKHLNVN